MHISNYRSLYAQNSKVLEGSAASAGNQQGSPSNETGSQVARHEARPAGPATVETDRVTLSEAARIAARFADTRYNERRTSVESGAELSIAAAAQLLAWSASASTDKANHATQIGNASSGAIDSIALTRSQAALQALSKFEIDSTVQRLRQHFDDALTETGTNDQTPQYLNPTQLDGQVGEWVRRSLAQRIRSDLSLKPLHGALD